jgi:hypothetical protein
VKLHLTVDQLSELTVTQTEALRKWWKPAKGDMFAWNRTHQDIGTVTYVDAVFSVDKEDGSILVFDGVGETTFNKDICLPILSLGQLLSLVDELMPGRMWYNLLRGMGHTRWEFDHPYGAFSEVSCVELIDLLWEIAKKLLPKVEQRCNGDCCNCPTEVE